MRKPATPLTSGSHRFGPGWCEPKAFEDYTRRCYTPAEAATATWAVRRSLEASGTILLFAHEKVHSHGPNLCFEKFGERTVKLALDRRHIPYLYRNAAEQFLAADAPGGFYGNAYSTMSKAVALLRSAHSDPRLRGASWAYDCALANSRSRWFPPRSNESVVTNHRALARPPALAPLPARPMLTDPIPPPRARHLVLTTLFLLPWQPVSLTCRPCRDNARRWPHLPALSCRRQRA